MFVHEPGECIRTRLELVLGYLRDLDHRRVCQMVLVRSALDPEGVQMATSVNSPEPGLIQDQDHRNQDQWEENLLQLKQQLRSLKIRDAGLVSQIRDLDRQILELRLDADSSHVLPSESPACNSRSSSGFYDFSEGLSLSNSLFSLSSTHDPETPPPPTEGPPTSIFGPQTLLRSLPSPSSSSPPQPPLCLLDSYILSLLYRRTLTSRPNQPRTTTQLLLHHRPPALSSSSPNPSSSSPNPSSSSPNPSSSSPNPSSSSPNPSSSSPNPSSSSPNPSSSSPNPSSSSPNPSGSLGPHAGFEMSQTSPEIAESTLSKGHLSPHTGDGTEGNMLKTRRRDQQGMKTPQSLDLDQEEDPGLRYKQRKDTHQNRSIQRRRVKSETCLRSNHALFNLESIEQSVHMCVGERKRRQRKRRGAEEDQEASRTSGSVRSTRRSSVKHRAPRSQERTGSRPIRALRRFDRSGAEDGSGSEVGGGERGGTRKKQQLVKIKASQTLKKRMQRLKSGTFTLLTTV